MSEPRYCWVCGKKKRMKDSLFCSRKCQNGDKTSLQKPNMYGVGSAGWETYKGFNKVK